MRQVRLVLSLFTLLALLGQAVPAPQRAGAAESASMTSAPSYELVGMGERGTAWGVNGAGTAVGDACTTEPPQYVCKSRAYRWDPFGGKVDLPPLLPGDHTGATAINEAGVIVGFSVPEPQGQETHLNNRRAVVWRANVPTALPHVAGSLGAEARAINEAGDVVGVAWFNAYYSVRGVLWRANGDVVVLPQLGEAFIMAPRAINNVGQVVGCAQFDRGGALAFLWEGGGLSVPGGESGVFSSCAYDINDAGQIVGDTANRVDVRDRAVIWQAGETIEIGRLSGDTSSSARAINNVGQVVGISSEGENRAFLWQAGQLIDLNTTVSPGSGWTIVNVTAISDTGYIVGGGISPDLGFTISGYVLVPGAAPPPPAPAPPGPNPPLPGVTYALTLQADGNGAIVPSADSPHAPGTRVVLYPQPAAGQIFIGWVVDGRYAGWANPLDLTMDAAHTVLAAFRPRPAFTDVAPSHPAYEPISQLAARGVIRGYPGGDFQPAATTLRAQMAALIARAMPPAPAPANWSTENWGNPFPDQGPVDRDLWLNVGTLAHYGVARGYQDGTYKPTEKVAHAQTISFITRAMVAQGYWTLQPDSGVYANVPDTGHRRDIATYVHYAGAIPGTTNTSQAWTVWSEASTRAWFAQALWQALNGYWSGDRTP